MQVITWKPTKCKHTVRKDCDIMHKVEQEWTAKPFHPTHTDLLRNNWDSRYCCTASSELCLTSIIAPCNATIHTQLNIRNYRENSWHHTIHTCTQWHTYWLYSTQIKVIRYLQTQKVMHNQKQGEKKFNVHLTTNFFSRSL